MPTQLPMDFARLVERMVPLVAELFATLAAKDPLRMRFANIASKTMLDMVDVLQSQGMSQEAVAASLGLTIGGFRSRMKRLREDDDDGGRAAGPRTLLERVFAEVAAREDSGAVATYDHLERRLKGTKEDSLRGVLHFLVTSGLLSVTGRGLAREYRVVSRPGAGAARPTDTVVLLYREGPLAREAVLTRLGIEAHVLDQHLRVLRQAGVLEETDSPDGPRYRVTDYHVPLDAGEGYEAALYDHVAAVLAAITRKVRLGRLRATMGDTVGGSTFTFTVPEDDPLLPEIVGFLSGSRARLEDWLARSRTAVTERPTSPRRRVTIYVGQNIEEDSP